MSRRARVVVEELNIYAYTTPEGLSVHLAEQQWVLHKLLLAEEGSPRRE